MQIQRWKYPNEFAAHIPRADNLPWSEPITRPLLAVLSSDGNPEDVERPFYPEGLAPLGYRDGMTVRIERGYASQPSRASCPMLPIS